MTDKLLIVSIVILFLGTLVWLEMRKPTQTQQTPSQPTETSTPTSQPQVTPSPTPTPIPTRQPRDTSMPESRPTPSPSVKIINLVPFAEYGANSTYGPGYEVQKAFDGSTSTRWSAAKNTYSDDIHLEWWPARVINKIRWFGLSSKWGAPKDFRVYCTRDGVLLAVFSVVVKNYQGSSWSDESVKDTEGNPPEANSCGIEIDAVQDKNFAATLTEIEVEGY